MDFACGSGSLLLNVRKRMGPHGIGKIYGQEKNITTYNLARMNMLLHGVKDSEFEIYHGDTLTNDWDMLRETNPAKKPYFDAVVANPPFSYRWEPERSDARGRAFQELRAGAEVGRGFCLSPARVSLPEGRRRDGDHPSARRVVPRRRGGKDPQKLLQDGNIDTVIGLPANLFYSTGIPVCILVLKKCKKPDDVLFINAAEHFEKGKRQNYLIDEHIKKIIDTYQHRREEERYAKRVGLDEIEANDYNLNISRYVSTAEAEVEIDLAATNADLVEIEKEIRDAVLKHNGFLKELGLNPLPSSAERAE